MGTSVKGESKKRKARRALSWLKSAAIVIAVLDLILAINDSRNVGRFFLLLSMSSTFSIVPENLLRDHCRESITGICQTYTQFATGKRLPSVKETLLKRRAYFEASKEDSPSKPFYPDYLSELVLSWKSMFDQSRAEANVSFYYDDSKREGSSKEIHEMGTRPPSAFVSPSLSPSAVKPTALNSRGTTTKGNNYNREKLSTDFPTTDVHEFVDDRILRRSNGESIASITTTSSGGSSSGGPSKSGDMASIHSYSIASDHTFLRMGRRKRDVLAGNAETGRSSTSRSSSTKAPFLISEPELNANGLSPDETEFTRNPEFSTSPPKSSVVLPPLTLSTHPSTREIDKGTTKETPTPTHQPLSYASSTVFISDDLTTRGLPDSSSLKVTHEEDRRKPLTRRPLDTVTSSQKSKVLLAAESQPPPPKRGKGTNIQGIKLNSAEDKKANSPNNISRNTKNLPKNGDFGLITKGPKELLGYVEEELFTRWPTLLETVQLLLEQKNMTSLQLVSPEATRIKMHIEVRPFGPDPFKDARKRLKATQQTLFDYPWLTIVQLYGRLSESFTTVFIGISLYTWVWGTAIALLLLIGSYREDQTTLHIWMVFNIIYTFLQFMIDNWIHTNIGPERSSVCLWLFNIYSVYKPLAAYIAITQLSEIEKARFDCEEDYLSSSTMKLIPSSCSRKSSIKGSSCGSPTVSTRTESSSLCDQQQHTSSPMVSCMTTTTKTTTTTTSSGGSESVGGANSLTTTSQLQQARLRESTIVDMASQSSLTLPLSAMLRASLGNSLLQSLVVWSPSVTYGDDQVHDDDSAEHHHNNHHCTEVQKRGNDVDEEYEEDLDEEDEEEDSLDDDDDDSDDEENKDQDYEDNDEACGGDNGGSSRGKPLGGGGGCLHHP